MTCLYLHGENLAPKKTTEAETLVGKTVEYILNRDIDRHRESASCRVGYVERIDGKHLILGGDFIHFSEISELIICKS